jgi:23S rRNA G2069 N7-methylase RlmK/C1962 C5-methylase RlmI
MTVELFMKMIKESVAECGLKAKLLELRMQAKDHACLIGYDECLYLKVAVLKIL